MKVPNVFVKITLNHLRKSLPEIVGTFSNPCDDVPAIALTFSNPCDDVPAIALAFSNPCDDVPAIALTFSNPYDDMPAIALTFSNPCDGLPSFPPIITPKKERLLTQPLPFLLLLIEVSDVSITTT